jgi:T-complex protein 1 subunit eta
MELSAHIRKHALSIPGKLQLIIAAFAKALEIIPRQICDNAGLDSTDILNKLRMKHATGEKWYGVDVDGASGVRNNMDAFVWEPSLVKVNAISSATEAACLILSVDETVRNPQSEAVSLYPPISLMDAYLSSSAKRRTECPTRYGATSAERQGTGYGSAVDGGRPMLRKRV